VKISRLEKVGFDWLFDCCTIAIPFGSSERVRPSKRSRSSMFRFAS